MTKANLERARRVFELYSTGNYTYATLGAELGLTRGQIARALANYKKFIENVTPQVKEKSKVKPPPLAEALGWPEYQFGVDPIPLTPIPRFTGALSLVGDFIVVGDVHLPMIDLALTERMIAVAERHLKPPRQLLIAGDLLNADALSRFNRRIVPPPFRDELRAARSFIKAMLGTFAYIYAFLGNHDVWVFNRFDGDFDILDFARLVADLEKRITISPYSHAVIMSGEERWYIPHQANYRQNALSVGRDLVGKEHCNVITAHQHHAAVGRDRSGLYTIVDCGGLFDPDLLSYAKLRPSTRPAMTQGFVLLRNGCATLLTPYPNMTDWDFYLPPQEKSPAIAGH